ncbi:hypothetical protein [Qipengyuania sphaerica]|uniref:hypothetical protein n=1 Tax=Qipengyuania sphaerica TaxID=2867243 RepID=UPI001C8A303C|nr:hypothetical protein [Qipengyuania sphaerica]MBX7541996.1 hypothetical protein [Qipengyuania sphaerica]
MGTAYLTLGLATMALPDLMIDISVQDPSQSNGLTRLIFQCFGLQASLFGLLALVSRFTRSTYLAIGAAILPVFVFDYWFYAVDPVLTLAGSLIDAIFNVVFIAMCWLGWRGLEK